MRSWTRSWLSCTGGRPRCPVAGTLAWSGDAAAGRSGLASLELWHTFQATGAELAWRWPPGCDAAGAGGLRRRPLAQRAGQRAPPQQASRGARGRHRLDDPGRRGEQDGYRLITTIGEAAKARAAELAALYPQRWEPETALDEPKTHQRDPSGCCAASIRKGVCQEVWVHLLVHHAIRMLVQQAVLDAEVDPNRLSFTRSLHITRRQVTSQAALPPGGWPGRPGRRSLSCCGTSSPTTPTRLAAGGRAQDEQLHAQARPPSPLADRAARPGVTIVASTRPRTLTQRHCA